MRRHQQARAEDREPLLPKALDRLSGPSPEDRPDKARLPKYTAKRVGMMIDDKETPKEMLLLDAEGKTEGIDLLAYMGYLHAGLKEAALEIRFLKQELSRLKERL